MKPRKQNTYLILISNWLGSAAIDAMTPAEEGAYFRLCLIAAESDDGSLPDDDYELARLSRMGSDWRKKPKGSPLTSGERIRKCFRVESGRLRHHQVDADRTRLEGVKQQRSDAARSRWGHQKKEREQYETDATASPPQCETTYGNLYGAMPSSSSSSSSEISGGVYPTADLAAAAAAIAEFAPHCSIPDPADPAIADLVAVVGGPEPIADLRKALARLSFSRRRPERSPIPWLAVVLPGEIAAIRRLRDTQTRGEVEHTEAIERQSAEIEREEREIAEASRIAAELPDRAERLRELKSRLRSDVQLNASRFSDRQIEQMAETALVREVRAEVMANG